MTCYLCQSPNDLSIKARHRDGTIRIKICKPCRRTQAKEYRSHKTVWDYYYLQLPKGWSQRAEESYKKVLEMRT